MVSSECNFMNNFETIELETKGQSVTIWMNRPEKHNALNALMIEELSAALSQCIDRHEFRVIILRGRGRSFSAGADLNYMKEISGFGHDQNYQDALRLASLFEKVYTCPKPVIAVVHGSSFGGANGLSAACDIVLADVNTVFAFSEVNIGITPATISPYVIRRSGEAAARELMLTGRRFTADEAYRFLLVNKVVATEIIEAELQQYIEMMLSSGPKAVEQCKKLIRVVSSTAQDTSEMMRFTANMIAAQRASDEGQEGISSFFEKRKPNWVQS
jgi:methylglutaconyl-CoA hydratase